MGSRCSFRAVFILGLFTSSWSSLFGCVGRVTVTVGFAGLIRLAISAIGTSSLVYAVSSMAMAKMRHVFQEKEKTGLSACDGRFGLSFASASCLI